MSCDSLVSSVSFERFWAITSSSIASILFIVCITSETPYACILECFPMSYLYFIPFCVLPRTGPGPQISSLWGCPWTGVLSILLLHLFELLPLLSLWLWLMAQPCTLNPVSGRRREAWRNRTPSHIPVAWTSLHGQTWLQQRWRDVLFILGGHMSGKIKTLIEEGTMNIGGKLVISATASSQLSLLVSKLTRRK